MTKKEYIDGISVRLRHLPRADYDMARDYFLEYFEEAGEENEQQAIADLGDPETAAQQIIMNIAIGNGSENEPGKRKGMKKGFSAIWVGILAMFAAPIALPFALVIVVVAIALLITILAFVFAVLLAAVCLVAGSVIGLVLGGCLLFSAPFDGLATMGSGFFFVGISVIAVLSCAKLWRFFVRSITKLFGRLIKRRTVHGGGRKDEIK